MFQPHRFTTAPVTLDFSSSGQGSHPDLRLLADGELLANAVGRVDWADDPVQVQVCESCGITHCETGGWLAFRQLGPAVVLVPAFQEMAENEQEYRPPELISRHGFLLLSASEYTDLRILVAELPTHECLKVLTGKEAAYLAQFTAPGRVLGKFPNTPVLDSSLIVAVDPGTPALQAATFDALLSRLAASSNPVAVRTTAGGTVTFYLDLPGNPGWPAFAVNGEPSLIITPELVVGAA